MATTPNFTTTVREALAWHKGASKEDKKAQDARTAKVFLSAAKKRKMVKVVKPSGRAGSVSAKPSVSITGTVGSRDIELGVKAS